MNEIDKILQLREAINQKTFGKSRELLSKMLSQLAIKTTNIIKLEVNVNKQNS